MASVEFPIPYTSAPVSYTHLDVYKRQGVLIVGVWQAVAMNTIIYISGLQTVPEDVYEASMLDGAGKWKQFLSLIHI